MIALDAIYNLELLYIKILTLWCQLQSSCCCRCHANLLLFFYKHIYKHNVCSTYFAYNAVLVMMYNNNTIYNVI